MIRGMLSGALRPLARLRARHGRTITWTAVAVAAAIVVLTRPFAGPANGPDGAAPPPASPSTPAGQHSTAEPSASGSTSARPTPGRNTPDVAHDDGLTGIQEFTPGPSTPPDAEANTVVARFAAAWVQRDLPAPQWWAGIAPYCENSYAEQLRTVDPGRVPAGKITGEPKPVQSRSNMAVYDVPTDAGTVQVTVAVVAGRWKVTDTDWRRRP
jgi:hypothetical protein